MVNIGFVSNNYTSMWWPILASFPIHIQVCGIKDHKIPGSAGSCLRYGHHFKTFHVDFVWRQCWSSSNHHPKCFRVVVKSRFVRINITKAFSASGNTKSCGSYTACTLSPYSNNYNHTSQNSETDCLLHYLAWKEGSGLEDQCFCFKVSVLTTDF